MKDKQGKHDHKLTKLLKFGLFATLMVAPLFAVLFKCMYTTINKNAYQSYSGRNSVTETITPVVNDTTSKLNTIYELSLTYDNSFTFDARNVWNVTMISYEATETSWQNFLNNGLLSLEMANNGNYIIFRNGIDAAKYYYFSATSIINIRFTFNNEVNVMNTSNFLSERTTTSNYYLDNAFYYSVDEMQNNSLFNWTTSTAIYTPINAMTSGLGITTDAVAILLTYWLYLTLIYIVIDIVVELFTWMTHTLLGKPLG